MHYGYAIGRISQPFEEGILHHRVEQGALADEKVDVFSSLLPEYKIVSSPEKRITHIAILYDIIFKIPGNHLKIASIPYFRDLYRTVKSAVVIAQDKGFPVFQHKPFQHA